MFATHRIENGYDIRAVHERRGYEVEHRSGRGDEGVDLLARKGSETLVVQCKRYGAQTISPAQVRELLGAVTATKATKGGLRYHVRFHRRGPGVWIRALS
ncbi:MAG: restriction endonuclease [Kofleriaceae bacterium]|nr:restriction endonuclease [Candidatus Methylomirabilis lanthanidiphila]